MYKSILLPIDPANSEHSAAAANEAKNLAATFGATIHLLGVVPDMRNSMVASYFPEGFEEESLERGDAELKAFQQKYLGDSANVQLHVAHGKVSEQILVSAKNAGADLIVMGAHRRDDISDFLIGSNAERVVRHAGISVLISRG